MIENSSPPATNNEELEQNEEYKTNKFLAFYKKQQNIFLNVDAKESDITSLYQSILQKEYVDLRSDLESSVAIHVLLKTEKNKMEQTFLKNAIQGLQLFQKNRDLLSAGFGNHLFSQMKVEYHQKFSAVFHFGDFGYKYYIVLKGSVDLLMPRSDCVEENSKLAEANGPQIPYFQRGNFEGLPHESFDQFLERQYPNMSFIKTFQPGEAFGEIALITGQKRTGSIIARENVCFLVITKQAFHEIVGRFHEFLQIQKLEFLSQFFFLQQIPKAKLLSLIQFMKILQYKRNNILYDERQPTNGIYFLKEGEVSITTKLSAPPPTSASQFGKSQLLRLGNKQNNAATKTTIKATNSFFGEEELVLELPQRKSKAVCISETCEIFLFTKDIIQTQGKQFNVLNKLKQNYELKSSWEEERNASIQSVVKQQEERISQFQRAQYSKISLSVSQLDPSVLIEQSPQASKKQFNTEEFTPFSSSTGTNLTKGKQYKSHSRFASTHESASYEPGSFSTAVSFMNQVSAPGVAASKKTMPQHLLPLGRRLSNFIGVDSPTPSKLKEESESVFSTRNKSEIFKIKPKSMHSLPPETTGTLRGTSNITNKDINNISIDKVFYDSTHTFFETKLKQSEQAKTEIFAKINSKSRSIQPISSLAEMNKPEFRIRKNSLQYIPQGTQQRYSLQSTFQSTPSVQSSEFNFQPRKADPNMSKEPLSNGNSASNSSKVQHLIGSSKQISQGYIQPSLPQQQLRQSTSQPSVLKDNIKNSSIHDNSPLLRNSNNNLSVPIIVSSSAHLQPLHFPSSHILPLSTLNQLDTLFEEDDDANSPRKRNLRLSDNSMEQKVQLLEKFQLGKKVAQYIRRKSESEKYMASNTLHNNPQQFQAVDQVCINPNNESGFSSKVDSPFSLKHKEFTLKKDIRKASFENPTSSQDQLVSKKPTKLSFVSPQIVVKKNMQ